MKKRRHLVKPGLTGLAQVNGRNSINWETKFKLDCKYVDKISFALDCKILFKTFEILLRRSDIDHAGKIMPKFTGNKKDEHITFISWEKSHPNEYHKRIH